LIVHAHGGPAVATAKLRSAAANTTRYPFRHLLKAGYRVFQPFFRGGLGFGDEFSQANIGSQGSTDSDLGDILSGLDHLIRERRLECEGKIGIFGGSCALRHALPASTYYTTGSSTSTRIRRIRRVTAATASRVHSSANESSSQVTVLL
jgi:hypothetical protein